MSVYIENSFDLTLPSLLHESPRLSEVLGISIWFKRDDLIPQFCGGNKVRKNSLIFQAYCQKNGKPDTLITNGGANSNHARVVALVGAQLGSKVWLVLHGSPLSSSKNTFLFKAAGANCVYVPANQIAEKIAALQEQEAHLGKSVFTVDGGGHVTEGVLAYERAVAELPFQPDFIVHASGTGGTQAGLINGVHKQGWNTSVLGISVARQADRGISEVKKFISTEISDSTLYFFDEYTCGGYEKTTVELERLVKKVTSLTGIYFDFTYTGKAMFGLYDLVQKGFIAKGSKVVFWHTGGLLNASC